jgi:hypothetical protein
MRFIFYVNFENDTKRILGRFWTVQQFLTSKNYLLAIQKIQKYNNNVEIFLYDDILNKNYKIGIKEKNKNLVMNELEIRSKF